VIAALAALAAGLGALSLSAAPAKERRIAFYNIHTKDTIDIVYMRNGRRIPEAMKKIDWVMRDWRQDESTRMDPELIDLIWEIHRELGSRQPVHIISGYRSAKTNNMLRKTRGGQARKSRHVLGKAADVHFPDVPVKRLRYSALIRERGGVGYYPTSAIPFVHVDTGRVRHWPRLPRHELALLFPDGKTKHRPARGGKITRRDVRTARIKYASLAEDIAGFHTFRRTPRPPRPILVAENSAPALPPFQTTLERAPRPITATEKAPAAPPQQRARRELRQLASLGNTGLPRPVSLGGGAPVTEAPKRLGTDLSAPAPRLVDRPTRLRSGPSESDRAQLTDLFTLASFVPFANLFGGGGVEGENAPPVMASQAANTPTGQPEQMTRLAAVDNGRTLEAASTPGQPAKVVRRFEFMPPETTGGWISAPAYDEEHPDELYYRPFPLGPFMTASSSPDDPALAKLVHPDVASTLDFIDDEGTAPPLRFTPRRTLAEALWTQQHFTGTATGSVAGRDASPSESEQGPELNSRSVRTSMR